MQFQADMLGIPVDVPDNTETTSLGSAYLAGLATGVFPDRDALARSAAHGAPVRAATGRPTSATTCWAAGARRCPDRSWAYGPASSRARVAGASTANASIRPAAT